MLKIIKSGYLFIGLLSAIVFSASVYFGFFSGIDNFITDSFFITKPIKQEILVIGIDNESLQEYGQWPWNRELLGRALSKMNEQPPKTVGIDLILSENSRVGIEDDEKLKNILNELKYPVVLAVEGNKVFLQKNNEVDFLIKPLKEFQNTRQVSLGHANIIVDPDQTVRQYPTKINFAGEIGKEELRSFAYEIALRSGLPIKKENKLLLQERIYYYGPAQSVRTISFKRIFEEKADFWQNKIVLIGVTATDLHDYQITPLQKSIPIAGVEIQANIVASLLNGDRLIVVPKIINILLIILLALLPVFLFWRLKKIIWPILICVFMVIIFYFFAMWLFEVGFILPLTNIIFALIFSTTVLFVYRYLIVEKEKRQIRNIFSRYVSKEVVGEIMKNPEAVVLGGEEREITVFFSDIRGFTTIAESMSSVKLVSMLNRYFTLMTNEITKHRGVFDKYIGDAIMAFWGAPLKDDNQVEEALKTSIEMLKKLKELNQEFSKEGLPEIKIGIGLFNGQAVVGNIGSAQRLNYTAMGDTVNTASRLESLNKEYGTQIIVGESVMKKCTGKYIFKFLGAVKVKGKNEEVNIYTIEV